MNREQIIKALECCLADRVICDNCPIQNECESNPFDATLVKYALALIKELTEENEYLKQQNEIYAVLNEKMEHICESYAFQYGTAVPKEVFLKKERERTVRKMQEEWNELKFLVEGEYYVFAEDLDLIAKEMLEE